MLKMLLSSIIPFSLLLTLCAIQLIQSQHNHGAHTENPEATLDLTVKDVKVPCGHSRWCKIIKLGLVEKKHVIKYSPLISSGSESIVKHILVGTCEFLNQDTKALNDLSSQAAFDCSDVNTQPKAVDSCYNSLMLTTSGGKPFKLPEEAGFPLGERDSSYAIVAVTYQASDEEDEKSDSSGVRVTYTSKLRQHDAGVFTLGSANIHSYVIPPKVPRFHYFFNCHPTCLDNRLPRNVKIFASAPKAHNLATQVKLHHFRNEEELPYLVHTKSDKHNQAELKRLDKVVNLKHGDLLTAECVYNTTSLDKAVLTDIDLCNPTLAYYPKSLTIPVQGCFSSPLTSVMMALTGVEEIKEVASSVNRNGHQDMIILPEEAANLTLNQYYAKKDDWDIDILTLSRSFMQYTKHRGQCRQFDPITPDLDMYISYPKINNEYTDDLDKESAAYEAMVTRKQLEPFNAADSEENEGLQKEGSDEEEKSENDVTEDSEEKKGKTENGSNSEELMSSFNITALFSSFDKF